MTLTVFSKGMKYCRGLSVREVLSLAFLLIMLVTGLVELCFTAVNVIHGLGNGVRGAVQLKESLELIYTRNLAEAGDTKAMMKMGLICRDGQKGVPPNMAESLTWFQKAADAGDVIGMLSMAAHYYYGEDEDAPPDLHQASFWLRKAADAGEPSAMTYLGSMYRDGEGGLPKDDALAVSWYQKAAAAGFASGMYELGLMYEEGRGRLRKDESSAAAWYRRAANADDEKGMYALGVMYEQGRGGLPKNVEEAVKWYRKAAKSYWFSEAGKNAKKALKRLGRQA